MFSHQSPRLLVRRAVRGVSVGRFETATFKDRLMGSRRSVGPLDKWVLINPLPPAESRGCKKGEKSPLGWWALGDVERKGTGITKTRPHVIIIRFYPDTLQAVMIRADIRPGRLMTNVQKQKR